MSTLSVPLSATHEEIVTSMVKRGFAPTKAEVMRRALMRLADEEAIEAVLRSQREVRAGKVIFGDLRKILKKIP